MDAAIAARCPARTNCRQHEIMCSTGCSWFIELRYQTELSGLPKRHAKYTVDTLPADFEYMDLWRRYTNDELLDRINTGKGLYLYGSTGNGKTTAAAAIAMTYIVRQSLQWMRTGERSRQLVSFAEVPELIEDMKRGFTDDNARDAVEAKIDALRTVPLAILDDIGAERPSEWVRERLLTIINARYDDELATVVTSNLSPSELSEPLGARIRSRIEGMTAPVKFIGHDRRLKL